MFSNKPQTAVNDQLAYENALRKFEKKLLKNIFLFITLVALITIHIIFHDFFIQKQIDMIIWLQTNIAQNIGVFSEKGLIYIFVFGEAFEFPYLFLFFTHFYASVYFGFSMFYGFFFIFTHIIGLLILSTLRTFFFSPRPFWIDSNVKGAYCGVSSCFPSLMTFGICRYFY